jgi:hypothetical protein
MSAVVTDLVVLSFFIAVCVTVVVCVRDCLEYGRRVRQMKIDHEQRTQQINLEHQESMQPATYEHEERMQPAKYEHEERMGLLAQIQQRQLNEAAALELEAARMQKTLLRPVEVRIRIENQKDA